MEKRKLETCFSPALFEPELLHDPIVVIIDILRASSSICTAFANGASRIIPVGTVGEARAHKENGFMVAAERDGYVLDFADFGNSPYNFTKEMVEGRTIVYSTTNGTGIIKLASSASCIVIGSFLNLSSLVKWLTAKDKNVLIFCAGWKNRFNLEDTICAGAIAERLMSTSLYYTICDSTHAAIDLWLLARNDVMGYIEKAAQRSRLREKGLDDCLEFCLSCDFTDVIPVLRNGVLETVDLNDQA